MGIIKISELMHENLRIASLAYTRSINAQAEHWMKIGMLMETHPDMTHSEISRLLVQCSMESDENTDSFRTLLNVGGTHRKASNE